MTDKLLKFKRLYLITPFLLAAIFTIIYALRSLHRHFSYHSHAFDLGIHTQAIYLYSQGLTPFSSLKNMLALSDHFGIILLLLAPLYKIFPTASTLLIVQALFVGLSSIPIYLIARDKLKSELLSFLITLSYLASSGIIAAIHFDFHLATISVLPLSLILYSWYFKKWRLYWLSLIFAALFKEDVFLFILGLGIYEIFQNQSKIGIASIIFSLVGFYLIKFQIMPFFYSGSENSYIGSSVLPLTSPIDFLGLLIIRPFILTDIIFNSPVKLNTIDALFRQFAFFSVLSPLSWLTVFPYLYLRFSSTLPHFWNMNWHYNANLEPFLAVSSVLAIAKFKLPKLPVALLLVFFLLTSGLAPNSPVWSAVTLDFTAAANKPYIENSLKNIPSSSSVSAQSPLVPHLANRTAIYMFPDTHGAEYIILDSSLSSYPLEPEILRKKITDLKSSPSWELIDESNTLVIFKNKLK